MSFTWDEHLTLKFVKLYLKHDCLWSKNSDGEKIQSALLQISNDMKISGFGANEVRLKINSIRSRYTNDMKKFEETSDSLPLSQWILLLHSKLHKMQPQRRTNFPKSGYFPKFTEEDTMKFIRLYAQHECLWNVDHPNYNNRTCKNDATIAIVDKFGMPGFHVEEFRTKVRNLRSTFSQEYGKVKEAIKSGNTYTPKLIWYPMMYSMVVGKNFVDDTSDWPVISEVVGNISENVNIIKEQAVEGDEEHFTFKFDSDTEEQSVESHCQFQSQTETTPMNEDLTLKFVKLYLEHDCLWNKNSDGEKIQSALLKISNDMKISGFGVNEVRLKINNIRSIYSREMKKFKDSSGLDTLPKPKQEWIQLLNLKLKNMQHQRRASLIKPGYFPKFTEEDTIKFIKLYGQHECLWNVDHPRYSNKACRNDATIAIVEKFGMPGFHVEEFRTKMRNLRSTFCQEYAKVKEAMKSGNAYTPKLIWYPMMHSMIVGKNFVDDTSDWPVINDVVGNASENANIIKEQVVEADEEDITFKFDLLTDESEESHFKIETSIEDCEDEDDQPLAKLAKLSHNSIENKTEFNSDEYDEHAAFGTYVVSTLKNLKKRDAILAQNEIQAILLRYRLSNIENDRPLPAVYQAVYQRIQ